MLSPWEISQIFGVNNGKENGPWEIFSVEIIRLNSGHENWDYIEIVKINS